jgi:hypothetical protein
MVGSLLFIRFVLLPLHEIRVEKTEILQAKYSRYIKGKDLLKQKEVLQTRVDEVNLRLSQYQSLYPTDLSSSKAQLTMQQQMQRLAQDKRIVLDEVEWVSTIEGNPEKALLEISFEGNLKDLMYFYTAIEQLGPWVSVTDIQYRVDEQRVNWKQLGQAKGKLTLEVFYLIKEAS